VALVTETRVPPPASRSLQGLSEAEAARLIEERGPVEPATTSRSMASIVRANVFTVFNLILVSFGVLTFAFGHWEDALFIGILVANAGIGIFQEWRAKRRSTGSQPSSRLTRPSCGKATPARPRWKRSCPAT
jgi:magnesium-transporting ATPase (P-type)